MEPDAGLTHSVLGAMWEVESWELRLAQEGAFFHLFPQQSDRGLKGGSS